MSTRRLLKAAAAVREVVSMAILTQVRDPRVRDVTVTRVEMAPDMRSATVFVSVMGSPAQEALALRGLASSAGFLQSAIADRIETRYTPRLRFEIDAGVKKSLAMARILAEVLPPDDVSPVAADEPAPAAGDDEPLPVIRGPADADGPADAMQQEHP